MRSAVGHRAAVILRESVPIARVAAVALAWFVILPAVAQARQTGGEKWLRFHWGAGVEAVYDSNLERRSDGPASAGIVGSVGTGLSADFGRSVFTLEYEYAEHRYQIGDEFSRSSHSGRSILTTRLSRALILSTTAEYGAGSSSEDREIGSQISVVPRIEIRADRRHRFRLQTGFRSRRFGDLSGSNSDNYVVSLGYRLGASRRPNVEFGSRFDRNATTDPRSRFHRWTHNVRFTTPVASRAELSLDVRQSTRVYPQRLLHMEPSRDVDVDEQELLDRYQESERRRTAPGPVPDTPDSSWMNLPRRDEIWMPSLGFTWRTNAGVEVQLGYQFETRISNDLRKGFSGHTTTIATRLRR